MNNERSCDKLLVKNNSRKHFVVFCALIEAKGTDIKMIKEELLITHHGRTLHGYFFKPEEKSHRLHVHFVGEVQGTSLVFQQRR